MTLQARLFAAALALFALTLAGSSALAQTRTLYDRLGGYRAISAVVDDFVKNVAADKRINRFFANANIDRLKARLVEQICQGTGGPCVYTGRDMKSVHAGMGIRGKDFDALVQDLAKSLNKFKVPAREQKQLVAILAPMKKDIVTHLRQRAGWAKARHIGLAVGTAFSAFATRAFLTRRQVNVDRRVGNGERRCPPYKCRLVRSPPRTRGPSLHFKTRSTCRISLKATAEWSMPLPADWPSPLTV